MGGIWYEMVKFSGDGSIFTFAGGNTEPGWNLLAAQLWSNGLHKNPVVHGGQVTFEFPLFPHVRGIMERADATGNFEYENKSVTFCDTLLILV